MVQAVPGADARLDRVLAVGPTPRRTPAIGGSSPPDLDLALSNWGVTAHVYGSHGWQLLTNMPYLHEGSDLDLSLAVPDFETACRVQALLAEVELERRLDGEIVFPGGKPSPGGSCNGW